MKKICALLTFLILVGIFIPAVSAEEYMFEFSSDSEILSGVTSNPTQSQTFAGTPNNRFYIMNAENVYGLTPQSISFQVPDSRFYSQPEKTSDWSRVTIGDWARADYGYFKFSVGSNNYYQVYLDNFEIINPYPEGMSGLKYFTIVPDNPNFYIPLSNYASYTAINPEGSVGFAIGNSRGGFYQTPQYYYYYRNWQQTLIINTAEIFDEIHLYRYDTSSRLNVTSPAGIVYDNTGGQDVYFRLYTSQTRPYVVNLTDTYNNDVYTYSIDSDGFLISTIPDDPIDTNTAVTVYVRNSQTNALLANANLIISASVNGNLHEVVNKTVPSGIYSIDLQPTGGGMPNPDFYRLIVTAEGYNSIMPYIDFEVDGATTIYAYLDPTGGAPEDENKTFIDFYVRDLAANGISGATVKFGGYNLITNSAGYTMFEVDKNKKYSWTVSKSGYGSLTGNAVIGADPRHTINTVLAPAVTPTIPTSIPTSTPISPTPTMTAPTGEPVSNWLEWFAAHFGMILGGGAEIGKIFMWLCFAVPVGVYVGKEAKAGAAGFMAGAGIVTLFFVLIGWVPIWLLVLLALIIGLLYAKIINNPDNGGGR